jgi:hypothetical protein
VIEVARFTNRVEADLARLLLDSNDILAIILDSEMSNFFGGAVIPVRLMVDDDDAEQAVAILAEG